MRPRGRRAGPRHPRRRRVNEPLTTLRLESGSAMGKDVRRIHVENGLSLRFPHRDEEFDEGVEIGILAVLMSSGARGFTHWVSTANVEQVRALAEGMGYRLTEGE